MSLNTDEIFSSWFFSISIVFFYFYFSNIFKKIIYLNLLTAVCHYRLLLLISQSLNSVQEGDFSGLLTKAPFPKICRTYPTTMKLGRLIPELEKIKEIHKSRDTPFEFCWHQHFFHRKSANFSISRNTDIILIHDF